MNKMLVIIFEEESQAYEGARALSELQSEGRLHLYAYLGIARDTDGKVKVKQQGDTGSVGAAVNVFTQNLLGRFGEPEGPVLDAGTFGRALFDLARLEAGEEFLSEVAQSLTPGKAAVIAEVSEAGTLAVDTYMQKLGGAVYRSTSSDVWDSRFQKDAVTLKAKLDEQKAKRDRQSGEARANLQKQEEAAETRLNAILGRIASRM